MVREEAKALSPKQCAVIELALDTIKVSEELNDFVNNMSSTDIQWWHKHSRCRIWISLEYKLFQKIFNQSAT